MDKKNIKKAGILALSTALISGALLFPSLSSANDEMYKLNNKVSVYMNAYDAKNRKNAAGKFGAGEYYVFRKFGNYINISDTPGEPGGWINPSDNKEEIKKVSSVKMTEVKTSENKSIRLNNDVITLNVNTPIYISASDAKSSTDQRGTFFPGTYYIYREYDGAFNITREKGIPGGWIYFDSETKNEIKVSNNLPKISETIETAKQTLEVISGKRNDDVINIVDQNKFILKTKVSGFMTAYNAENSLEDVNTVYPGEYYVYTRYNGMINVTTQKDVPGSWINPNHTKVVEVKIEKTETEKEEIKKEETKKEETKKESVEEVKEEKKQEEKSSDVMEEVKETSSEVLKEEKQETTSEVEKKVVEKKSAEKEVVKESAQQLYDIVDFARQYVGYNYVYGSMSPSIGFDCSGLTSYVLKNTKGISIARGAQGQFYGGQPVSKDNLQAGDLVFFGDSIYDINHVGIYDGNGNVIHASTEDTGVIVSNFYSSWYQNYYVGARRY
ncbi:C40 family peptidase [Helcococcus ovis]|uniref:C40 family peptidase n=1 Tax=Helcococcus ovis TaxID=72026 RepID=UPI001430A79E|nr:C40 family peptidase [Helcococcus ovis]WNZ01495.1 C40 family peptidase [Helcococcus ovis]